MLQAAMPQAASAVQVVFVAFAVATALWVGLLLRAGDQRHSLHHMMTGLVVAKTLTLLSQVRLLCMTTLGSCQAVW